MWMVCPPSARLGERLADQGSTYTEEGTLAHRIGELLLRKRWEGADITAELEQAQADPLYSGAMGEHMESYAAFIEERMAEARTRCEDPVSSSSRPCASRNTSLAVSALRMLSSFPTG